MREAGREDALWLALPAGRTKNLSGGKAAAIVNELYINRSEFSRLTGSFKRCISSEFYKFFLGRTTTYLQSSPDWTGRNTIHADTFRTELFRKRFNIVHRCCFCLCIIIE